MINKFTNSGEENILRWLAVILWSLVIFTLSSIEQITVSQLFFWDFLIKKLAHVSEYVILFMLIFRATKEKWLKTFSITLLFAASDEFHQSFVPGRAATIVDIGFDTAGASIASYIIWKLEQIRQAKQKK